MPDTSVTVLFAGGDARWQEYEAPLHAAFAAQGLNVALSDCGTDPEAVDYIVYAPTADRVDFTRYPNVKAVLSLFAGVDRIVGDPGLTQPLCRMVDPSLAQGMVEWVTGHVLRHHLGMDKHICGQDGVWRGDTVPPVAWDRPVTVLGLGELGMRCASALAGLGFPVTGWSRRPKEVPGVRCLSGEAGLADALASAQILVLLLPSTPATENTLNAQTLALLPAGAVVINPGRGPLIDDTALLAALDAGQVGHATLDVFRTEPLPADHPYWGHPRVTVTPHIAAATRARTSAIIVAENIRRGEAGEPFLYLVDRQAGY